MNKNIAPSWKKRFAYDWWKFLLLGGIVSFLIYFLYYFADRVKPSEKLQIFTSCDIKDEAYGKKLRDKYHEKGVLQFAILSIDSSSDYYDTSLGSQGLYVSDVLIVPESKLGNGIYYNVCQFDDEFKASCEESNPNGLEYFVYTNPNDGRNLTMGVKIHDAIDEEYNKHFAFDEWLIMHDENYYMMITSYSANNGRLSKKSETDNALKLYLDLMRVSKNV